MTFLTRGLVAFLLVLLPGWTMAEAWKTASETSLMLTQNAYSENWAGEETGSISWILNSKTLLENQLHPRVHNKNTLKFSFGQTHNQDSETKSWEKPVKSTDLIDLETIFRFTYGLFIDPFASARLESQFLDKSYPAEARYVNPLKFTESVGLARAIVKEEGREWTARVGAGFRQYVDRDVLTDSLGDTRETQTANDGGLEFVNELNTPLAGERITLSNKLTVFQALFYSESDELEGLPNEDHWKAPDVNWENILTASITSYLMVNLYTQLLYDKELDLGARFKQTLSLGITYKTG
jgi:hypothetical protein